MYIARGDNINVSGMDFVYFIFNSYSLRAWTFSEAEKFILRR